MNKNNGDVIRKWRTELGLSQKEFAEKLSIEQPTLSNYEKGKTQVPIDIRLKIVSYFKKDLREIFPEIVPALNLNQSLNAVGYSDDNATVLNAIRELTMEVKKLAERTNTTT